VDTSALVKRVVPEAESEAFTQWFDGALADGIELLASALAEVELARVVRVRMPAVSVLELAPYVEAALSGVDVVPLEPDVVELAQWLGPGTLRSLDALHLATARVLNVDFLVTYDRHLADACAYVGLRVVTPRPAT